MSRPAPGEFYGNPDWDVDAWVEVIGVEYERLIGAFPFDAVFRGLGGSIDLLDVGCGTAIFPSYLDAVLADGVHIRADLLDRSEASLAIAGEVIAGLDHFSVGRTFHAHIEDLPEFGESEFDVIWAIHSFTTVDRDRMPRTYQRLLAALRRGGWLLVYQLTAASAYQRVHDRYRARRGGDRYMEFEDSVRILDAAGLDYDVHELSFDHVVPDHPAALGRYVQKVTLDDSVSAEEFEPLLDDYRGDGEVRFPQTVNLIAVPAPSRR